MSGIVGIWNVDGRHVAPSLLAVLGGSLSHRGSDAYGQWVEGPAGLACHLLRVTPESLAETQPAIGPSGTVLVFDGRLDNRDELLALREEAPVTAASPDPDLVLAAYERFGDRVVEYLNGEFAFGLFDPKRRLLLLARDAIGIRPLYYTRTQSSLIFASEIKALLAHPDVRSAPNEDMLACYLVSSAPEDPSVTCFKDIVSLLPAHCAVVTPDRLTVRRYWDFVVTEQRFSSFHDCAQAFRRHFTEAVKRRLRSAYPVAVSVSGGLDSSSILCCGETLKRVDRMLGPSLVGMSYLSPAGSPSDEKAFLVEIERQYALSIERVPIAAFGLMDDCHSAIWHVEAPFLDSQWNTTQTFYRRAREHGIRVMLTGHWGDQVLFPQAYLVDLFRQLRWRDIARHLRAFEHWMADVSSALFRTRFWLDLVRYHVPARFIPVLRRLRSSGLPDWYTARFRRKAYYHLLHRPVLRSHLPTIHARSLYQEIRAPYHVHCMEWNNKVAATYGMEVVFPFLDRDLLSFLMSIPGDLQTWQGMPKALLREGLRGILPDAIVSRRWKADFSHLVNEGLVRDYSRILDCLESGTAVFRWGYVDRTRLRTHLARLRSQLQNAPTCEAAWALSDLVALEVWHQVFVETRGAGSQTRIEDHGRTKVCAGGTA
jgi:asparagine synthase (glutamine-hydrolysing)